MMSDAEMTTAEMTIADDKMRAEIAKLIAETSKINIESMKLQTENRWYPFVATAAIFGAALAIAKFFFS
jgi:hypothetical protein